MSGTDFLPGSAGALLLTNFARLGSSESTTGARMKKPRVGVIMGGTSGEREVSLRSGAAVAGALSARGHDVVHIVLSEGGDPGLAIRRSGIDVAFLALHGRLGEDGCVQGLCELYGIPYTGSSVLASVLGAIEVAPKKGMYDYESKYTPGLTEYFMPARLPPTRYGGVLNLAERAARILGCSGGVRVDLLVTEGQNEYVLEVNTLPGMTETSLLPEIAEAAGYDF